jgi:Ca2+-binding EF-hand superfamily protein
MVAAVRSLQAGLRQLGEEVDASELDYIISQTDRNGDETIDYEEFSKM